MHALVAMMLEDLGMFEAAHPCQPIMVCLQRPQLLKEALLPLGPDPTCKIATQVCVLYSVCTCFTPHKYWP